MSYVIDYIATAIHCQNKDEKRKKTKLNQSKHTIVNTLKKNSMYVLAPRSLFNAVDRSSSQGGLKINNVEIRTNHSQSRVSEQIMQ